MNRYTKMTDLYNYVFGELIPYMCKNNPSCSLFVLTLISKSIHEEIYRLFNNRPELLTPIQINAGTINYVYICSRLLDLINRQFEREDGVKLSYVSTYEEVYKRIDLDSNNCKDQINSAVRLIGVRFLM